MIAKLYNTLTLLNEKKMKNKLEDLIHQQLFVSNSYQDMMNMQGRKQQDLTKTIIFLKEKQNKFVNNFIKSSIAEIRVKPNIQLENLPLAEEKQTLFAEDDEVMSHFQDSLKLNRRLGELLAK